MPRLRGARDCGENAMSLQAMLVRLFMRLTVKRKIHKAEELAPAKVRATIEKMSARTRGKWPDMVKVEPVAVNGVKAYWISTPNSEADKVYYYLHGGGYVFGSPDTTHLDLLWRLAHASKARVFAIDYRKAPENPYPAALDDAVAGYEFLLAAGILPQSIAIGGDSAGGGLTMATLLRLKDEGKDLPSCATLLSPWTDLAVTGTTLGTSLQLTASNGDLTIDDAVTVGTDIDLVADNDVFVNEAIVSNDPADGNVVIVADADGIGGGGISFGPGGSVTAAGLGLSAGDDIGTAEDDGDVPLVIDVDTLAVQSGGDINFGDASFTGLN